LPELGISGAADRVLAFPAGIKRRWRNLKPGPFALNPRKIECPNSPVNFVFSYC
jgi:hypothetical protein